MESCIKAVALTTFDVGPDGETVRLGVRDQAGREASLVLPTLCVNQLLLTLPRIIEAALRRSRNDDSLRLAHPLEAFTIERGERNGAGEVRYIVTLHTDEHLQVSFAATRHLLGSMAFSIAEDVLDSPVEPPQPDLNS
jgi:hypothetical protein